MNKGTQIRLQDSDFMLLYSYPETEWLGHKVILFLIFCHIAILFSTVVTQFCMNKMFRFHRVLTCHCVLALPLGAGRGVSL